MPERQKPDLTIALRNVARNARKHTFGIPDAGRFQQAIQYCYNCEHVILSVYNGETSLGCSLGIDIMPLVPHGIISIGEINCESKKT